MNPVLRNVADILPAILRNAIPKPSGPGYLLELEGAEMDALRELAAKLTTCAKWDHARPPVDG